MINILNIYANLRKIVKNINYNNNRKTIKMLIYENLLRLKENTKKRKKMHI